MFLMKIGVNGMSYYENWKYCTRISIFIVYKSVFTQTWIITRVRFIFKRHYLFYIANMGSKLANNIWQFWQNVKITILYKYFIKKYWEQCEYISNISTILTDYSFATVAVLYIYISFMTAVASFFFRH